MKKKLLPILLAAALLSSCGKVIAETAPEQTETTVSETTAVQTTTAGIAAVTTTAPAQTTAASSETQTSQPTETTTSAPDSAADGPEIQTILPDAETEQGFEISSPYSKAAAVYCLDDEELICGHDLDKRISLASVTKLLTASTALKYLATDTQITVGTEIYMVQPDSTLAYLYEGETLTLNDLLYAMLLPSGNDAAYTVAVNTARWESGDWSMTDQQAVEYFVGLMNDTAQELGMTKSHFANPEGWDDAQHYTTMNDLLKLLSHAMSLPALREAVSYYDYVAYNYDGSTAYWVNTNKLLNQYSEFYDPDVIGIKTGTTAKAGCCLTAAFERGGKTYIVAVMGCKEEDDRYVLARKLAEKYLPAE